MKVLRYGWPAFGWAIFVLRMTLAAPSGLSRFGWLVAIPNVDKFVHIFLFGGQTWWLAWAFLKMNAQKYGFWSVGLSVVFGILIEIIQPSFGRSADIWDALADGVGAGIAFFLFTQIFSKKTVK
ncbi:VanZ like family protein [Flexibacter flexilis DSM 6793]|uniref:VanZ like family protein n=1 Tax=Flexibacter flexilis DSM 6793 TaxID=927664 RepID=A0A1I1L2A0_9BACT|nr:VanZ family protein [Flexibacter flexilis]SFC63730.1 VanZ like family protein [Flexibacter flexilis DSM 6793]